MTISVLKVDISVHDNFGTYETNFGSLEYNFSSCEVPFQYILKSISVHFKRNFATCLACSAAGLQMPN